MRRLLVGLAVTGFALASIVPTARAEEVSVAPGAGSQNDTFVVGGRGFRPGAQLEETFTAPNGTEYTTLASGLTPVVTVAGDGTFSVSIVPARDFPGILPGVWEAEFCYEDGTCWEVNFTVVP